MCKLAKDKKARRFKWKVDWVVLSGTESQPVYKFCDESTCLSFSFDTEKRYQVAKEILETEKKYLSCLRTLKEVRFVILEET